MTMLAAGEHISFAAVARQHISSSGDISTGAGTR
jgi:hypothetical protein